MLKIEKTYIQEVNSKSRLIFDIYLDNNLKQVYFEVEKEYEKFLCYERCDAIVIGLLNWAMRYNHDFVSNIPITEELIYNINEYLIPSLTKYDKRLHNIKISAPFAIEPIKNAGAVGTGISCGVDSFHVIHNHYKCKYKSMELTHLCINSVGSFHKGYKNYGIEKAKEDVRNRAKQVADELGLPLIISDSNIKDEFNIFFEHNHTYYSMFAVYCLQKLWSIYFYASGYEFYYFNLKDSSTKDSAYYDLLSLQFFSTHNLVLYSEGGTENRIEKTKTICSNNLPQRYLHVCCTKGYNCGTCLKCRRTLLTLDILNRLDDFRDCFDIDYYKKHRNEYILWLYDKKIKKDIMCKPIYEAMKKDFTLSFKIKYHLRYLINKMFGMEFIENKVILKIFFIKISFKIRNRKKNESR